MWTTLALMSALSCTPAQAGQLELKNARYTYGIHGQERKDSTFLAGDMAILSFDIEGLQVKDDGSARYSMALKLYNNKKGKYLYDKAPEEYTVTNSLGGTRQPVYVMTNIFPDMEPADYTITVEVKDVLGKTSAKLDRKFTVRPLEFGLVRVGLVYIPNQAPADSQFTPAPPVAVPGQNLMLHFTAVGFTEAGDKNQPKPKVKVKMVIQDEAGNPVLGKNGKPITGEATKCEKDELTKLKFIPFQVPIQINRSGKFKVVLSATDEHSGKTATLPPLDLTALEVK